MIDSGAVTARPVSGLAAKVDVALILGGAALQRCDKHFLPPAALAAEVKRRERVFRQPVIARLTWRHKCARAAVRLCEFRSAR